MAPFNTFYELNTFHIFYTFHTFHTFKAFNKFNTIKYTFNVNFYFDCSNSTIVTGCYNVTGLISQRGLRKYIPHYIRSRLRCVHSQLLI